MIKKEDFKGRDFLTLMDFNPKEIQYILNISQNLKKEYKNKKFHRSLSGRTVSLIFEKPSTRTRFSFQTAISQLGMNSFFTNPDSMQLSRGELIKDTARVIDRYCDALVIRTFDQKIVEEYAHFMKNPVINGLTDLTHPCQGLADMLTIKEFKGKLKGKKLSYVGDPWNVCHTLMICCSLLEIDCYIASPNEYKPSSIIKDFAKENAKKQDTDLVITNDLEEALLNSDIVYANTFHSMGQKDIEKRRKIFADYQINDKTIAFAKDDAIFMHCLPCYRGEEVTDEIIEGKQSVIFEQSENRMHTEKAILSLIVK